MTQEVAMHRWDGQQAVGEPAPIDSDIATDGIDEMFELLADRQPDVFAGEGTLHFHATDIEGEWMVTRGPAGISVEHGHGKGDVAARGRASDLLLFVWNRQGTGPLEVFGDSELLASWQAEVRF
jgi:predicted lipid carrier protein YhbT